MGYSMSKNSTDNFQRQFIRLVLRRLPHHISLYTASKLHSKTAVKLLDSYAKKHIIASGKLQSFSAKEQQQYKSTTHQATLWHGSGRFQYSNGEIIDVLKSILASGAIRPVEDAYAIFSGGRLMRSISLTRLRIIARCYADMHGKGYHEPNRYGDALTLTSYHYGLFYARLYTIHYRKIKQYYKIWHKHTHDDNGHNTWGKKSNKGAEDVWDVFGLGSDISGNYPIVFGIKDVKGTTELSSVFRDYEVRTENTISIGNLTHIEVPLSKVKETEVLIANHQLNTPVYPIELGELMASQTPFSELLGLAAK